MGYGEKYFPDGRYNPAHNLVPMSERTPEEQLAIRRKGGAAKMAEFKRQKSMREAAKAVLSMQLIDDDLIKAELEKRGLDATGGQGVLLAALAKALRGDIEAARFVRDTAGEAPAQQMNIGVLDKPVEEINLAELTEAELQQLAAENPRENCGKEEE